MRPNPDGFAPEVRTEMEKLFWWGRRALLSLTKEGGQNGELNLPPVSTRFPSALWGFGSSFPLIVAHASGPRSLEPGAGNLCTFRRAKLLVPVRMCC